MRLKPFDTRPEHGVRGFAADARGAVAPMFGVLFAFALLPMGGAAIDLSRVMSSRSDLQDSLDATALALGKLPLNSTPEQLQAAADKWIHENVHDQNLSGLKVAVAATYADNTTTMSKVELTATAAVISIFSGSIGGVDFGQYPVGARTTTSWGLQRVEVALVLDNTGSMMESDGSGGTKSSTLKQASKDLIDALAAVATASGDPNVFKVGMVPFATYVNVGAANKGAWITGVSPYANDLFTTAGTDRFDLFTKLGTTWGGCVESRPSGGEDYDITDKPPTPSDPKSMFVPYFAPDEPDDVYTDGAGQVWDQYSNSYLPDAVAPGSDWITKQGNVGKYTGTPTRVHPWRYMHGVSEAGPNKDCPNVPLIRLTTSYNSVKSAIDNLAPAGNTHIPLGLVWGWHLLSPNAPFSNGVPYGTPNVRKVVILVTDGNNTYWAGGANPSFPVNNETSQSTDNSAYTSYGYVWQQRIAQNGGATNDPALAMNDRLSQLCANMQNAGVTLYTVPLRVTDANTKAMLQNCASSADKYLEANSGAELKEKFESIAGSISALRISK